MREIDIASIQTLNNQALFEVDRICRENGIDYFLAYGTLLGAVRHNGAIPWDSDCDILVRWNQYQKLVKALYRSLPDRYCVFETSISKGYAGLFVRVGLRGLSHAVIHVDVFPIIGAPDKRKTQKLFCTKLRLISRLYYCKINPIFYPKGIIKRLILILTKALLLPVPKTYFLHSTWRMFRKYPPDSQFVMNGCGGYGIREIVPSKYYQQHIDWDYCGRKMRIPKMYDEILRHFYQDYMRFPSKQSIDEGMQVREVVPDCFEMMMDGDGEE